MTRLVMNVGKASGIGPGDVVGVIAGLARVSRENIGAIELLDQQTFVDVAEDSANVVLLTEAPTHLTARGQSHRGAADPAVPEIGDEVAVARALRHLADQLLDTAAQDVEAVTGEDAHIRPS